MTTELSISEQLPAALFHAHPTGSPAHAGVLYRSAQQPPHPPRLPQRRLPLCGLVSGTPDQQLTDVQPVHVAAFIQDLQGQLAPATVKQHLAALRVLFDWLVTGHILQLNPAHAVRGPKWLTIPERGLSPGVAIFGSVGAAQQITASPSPIPSRTCSQIRSRTRAE